jgi:hypothetical protein
MSKSGKLRTIGEGHGGQVYRGRVAFGGKSKRVAIKVLKGEERLTEKKAKQQWKIIQALRAAGVRLPKMGFVKDERLGWVLVSELYIRDGKSTLKRAYGNYTWTDDDFHINNRQVREETMVELVKVANAGFYPDAHLVDFFEHLTRKNRQTMPIDLHRIFERGKITSTECANELLHNIWMMTDDIPERYRLLKIARTIATPEIRRALTVELKKMKEIFRASSKRHGGPL